MGFRSDCESKNIPIISLKTEEFLAKKINGLKPKNILEIGSAVCYSTIFFANIIESWGGKITTFEISQPSYWEGYKNIYKNGIHNIFQYNFDFLKSHTKIFMKNKVFDFIFVDARKSEYKQYFLEIQKYVTNGTLIVFDDIIKFQNKMQDFFDLINSQNIEYEILQLDKDDGILIIEIK